MRELTIEEQELIAGGSITDGGGGGGDIVVVADGGGGGDWGDYGGGDWGDYGDYGGGDGGGGGGDAGGSGADAHADKSDLSPDPSIDLSDVNLLPVAIGGHVVNVLIDQKTAPTFSDAYYKAIDAVTNLSLSYDSLNQAAKDALSHVQNIAFVDVNRSFSQEDSHTFFFDTSELVTASTAFAASNIVHDALHISVFDATNDLNQSRGIAAEVAGWQLQVDNAAALGLSAYEVQYLQGLIADPASQTPRIEQPPYGG